MGSCDNPVASTYERSRLTIYTTNSLSTTRDIKRILVRNITHLKETTKNQNRRRGRNEERKKRQYEMKRQKGGDCCKNKTKCLNSGMIQ